VVVDDSVDVDEEAWEDKMLFPVESVFMEPEDKEEEGVLKGALLAPLAEETEDDLTEDPSVDNDIITPSCLTYL
jgi:hypothetical protein